MAFVSCSNEQLCPFGTLEIQLQTADVFKLRVIKVSSYQSVKTRDNVYFKLMLIFQAFIVQHR